MIDTDTPASTLLTLSDLYAANTPGALWQLEKPVALARWVAAAAAVVHVLPLDAAQVLSASGWPRLMEYILGEGQFGPDRYRLSRARRAYYRVRPVLPRAVVGLVRRGMSLRPTADFQLGWPIEDRYVRFVTELVQRVEPRIPLAQLRSRLWPNAAGHAFVLTHDVERASGQAFVRTLAAIDERYGFRSCFNFVLEDYAVDQTLVAELLARGFEVGIHGLKHDGSLFSGWARFKRDAQRISQAARAGRLAGFRSPATHRNPAWMQLLDVEYDSSFFDTDPWEVMPGGTMSIWPFFCGRFVELPYTLAQDHTLFTVLGERTPRVWVEKLDFIARWGGMALLNAHPDYLQTPLHLGVYEEFLQEVRKTARRTTGDGTAPAQWNALPREVARWWSERAGRGAITRSADATDGELGRAGVPSGRH